MRPVMRNDRLPYQLRSFGPGPSRWGWILRLPAGPGYWSSFEKVSQLRKTALELGLLWNRDILAVPCGGMWSPEPGYVLVGIVNDPKYTWVLRAVTGRPGRAAVVSVHTWWDREG